MKFNNIDEFLKNNTRSLKNPEFYYGIDNNQPDIERFCKENLNVLFVSLSTGSVRSSSVTYDSIHTLLEDTLGKNCFIDCAFMPEQENVNILKENKIPWIFGNVSHKTVEDYDLVIITQSILTEVYNLPEILNQSGIPLTIQQRQNKNYPLFIVGGASSTETPIIYGKMSDSKGNFLGNSFVDLAGYGEAKGILDEIFKFLYERKKIKGCKHTSELIEDMINEKVAYKYLFYPDKYEFVYQDNFRIKEIKKLDHRVPDTVLFNRNKSEKITGFPNKTFYLNGSNSRGIDILISTGCTGQSNACSFCLEGNNHGIYRERSLEDIESDMITSLETCAPDTLSFMSYNLNYFSKFMSLLNLGAKHYSNISLLNERMDVIAECPEQLKIAKKLGLARISGAIEGISDRLRNKIFNKNLSEDSILKACENIFSLKLMSFKCGFVLSGLETEEDIDEFIDLIDKILAIREKYGSKTTFKVTFTPLLIYLSTPLRYQYRFSAYASLNNIKRLDKIVEALSDRGLKAKIYGKGLDIYLQQIAVDFGPIGTQWLYNCCVRDGITFIRTMLKDNQPKMLDNLKELGYDLNFFFEKRNYDFIFPNSYITTFSEKLNEDFKNRDKCLNFNNPLCLKTPANKNPVCFNCGMCDKDKTLMLSRNIVDTATQDDVIKTLTENRRVKTFRIVVAKDKNWFFYNTEAIAHYLTSLFLRNNGYLRDNFHSIGNFSTQGISKNGQFEWYGGLTAFDLNFKCNVSLSNLTFYSKIINESTTAFKIKNIYEECNDTRIKNRCMFISYIGSTDRYSYDYLKSKYTDFDWMIKKPERSSGSLMRLKKEKLPEIKKNILFSVDKKTINIFMFLPCQTSPYMVLSSMIRKSYESVLKDFKFNIIDNTVPIDLTCKCGKNLQFSYFYNKIYKKCPICQGKTILYEQKM